MKYNKLVYSICAYAAVFCCVFILWGCGNSEDIYELSEYSGAASDYGEAVQGETYSQQQAGGSNAKSTQNEGLQKSGSQTENSQTDTTIFVYICGEVVRPGVYELSWGSRMYELINQAGGFTAAAERNYLNQAEVLSDSQQVYVPSKKELDSGKITINSSGNKEAEKSSGNSLININTADSNLLQQITGIGESRAADIIAYRERNGSFKCIEDIMKVPGIKEGLFNKIKDRITV